jgi:hypothetical protein
MRKHITTLAVVLLLAGCTTFYKSTVTLTAVVDSAMRSWAQLSVAGQTSASLDAQVIKVHAIYQKSCGVAATALEAYKAGGDKASYILALEVARATAGDLFDLILPLLSSAKQTTLTTQLRNAVTP